MKGMQVDNLKVLQDPLGLFFGTVGRQYLVEKGTARLVVAMVTFDFMSPGVFPASVAPGA